MPKCHQCVFLTSTVCIFKQTVETKRKLFSHRCLEGLEALARLTTSCHNARAQWQNDPTGVNIETVSGQRRTQRHNAKRRLSDDHSRGLIDDQSRPNNVYNEKTGSRTEVKKCRNIFASDIPSKIHLEEQHVNVMPVSSPVLN